MTQHTRRPAKEIFAEASRLSPSERAAFLAESCGDDQSLRAEVDRLLRAYDAAGKEGFLSNPTAGAATIPGPPIEVPGTMIGPYKLLELIGEGGFGSVFMAEQETPVRRRVALKIIKWGMDTRQIVARFEQERQALALMEHPGIAKVLEAGATSTGRPYFVMELVRGDPITKYCDANSLSLAERLDLFAQVCLAVQHAHSKGVIHRDLKPGNVLVTVIDGKPVPKVIDFGVAKATSARLTEKTLFTEFRAFLGTPEYMSPEQAVMSGVDIDTRSDVYSLGVLLYELLTGVTPFDARTLREAAFDEIRRIIREDEPPKPSTRLSTLDTLTSIAAQRKTEPRRLGTMMRGELDWIVMKALEKDRARRYDTAVALAEDVGRHLAGEPVRAAPPSAPYRARKFVRRHLVGVSTGSIVAVAILVGVAFSLIGLVAAREARRAAEMARDQEMRARVDAETQRLAAQAEAAKAEQIAEFLRASLTASDPSSPGREMSAKEVLDAASTKLDRGEMTDQPEAQASIHAALGNAYKNAGDLDSAEKHLRAALDLRIKSMGPDHTSVQADRVALDALLNAKAK